MLVIVSTQSKSKKGRDMLATGPNTDRYQEEFSFSVSIFLVYFVKTFALCCPTNSNIKNTFSNDTKNHSQRWLFNKVYLILSEHTK